MGFTPPTFYIRKAQGSLVNASKQILFYTPWDMKWPIGQPLPTREGMVVTLMAVKYMTEINCSQGNCVVSWERSGGFRAVEYKEAYISYGYFVMENPFHTPNVEPLI